MTITKQLASKIWEAKSEFGTLSKVHQDFIRWGGECSYETFRQFANELISGNGDLINQLHQYFEENNK